MDNPTAILNVHIFEGDGFSQPSSVLIDGSTIKLQSPSSSTPVIDGCGGYLIPGLIDAHLHVATRDGLAKLASFGVTTALNMAGSTPIDKEIRDLRGLTSWYTAGEPAIAPNTAHARIPNGATRISTLEQVEPLVAKAFDQGADYYKIVAEKGGPSVEIQTKIVEATHARGKKVMTHAVGVEFVEEAVKSNADGLQHVANDRLLPPELIAQMKAQGQTVTPTMSLFKIGLNSFLFKMIPGSSFSTGKWEVVVENVRALHQAGIPVLAGTDAIGRIGLNYGDMLHSELECLVEAGFTPAEAIRAATSVPAEFHGLKDRGVIDNGKRADLVLLSDNPLEDIQNTRKIQKVWIAGVEVKAPENQSCAIQ